MGSEPVEIEVPEFDSAGVRNRFRGEYQAATVF
jgi:hypothetical protein